MMRFKKITGLAIIIVYLVTIIGCENSFEFSPYAANVDDSHKGIYKTNMSKLIIADSTKKGKIKFAVLADSHFRYHQLKNAIDDLNSKGDIDFVIANGDITDNGYLKEYELFHSEMKKLTVPYIAVIGNHDYKSNGELIYKKMYGTFNKSFSYNDYLFILFDDVFWESNKKPDFYWLEKELKFSENYPRVFVLCHIPPFDSQFNNECRELYKSLMVEHHVDLSIHAHVHKHINEEYYEDGTNYLTVEAIMDNGYTIVTVSDREITIEPVNY